MLNRRGVLPLYAAAVIASAAVALAQNKAADRFTFTLERSDQTGASWEGRFEIVVNRWSSDEERARVMEAFAAKDPQWLARAITGGYELGYIKWPGNLQYNLRFAHRAPRQDGTEDIVVAADRPMGLWWEEKRPHAREPFTLIQLRLNKQGTGEGKVSIAGRLGADTAAKTIVIEDFDTQPTILADVRRDRATSSN
jgi:hypothetical protein